MKTSTLTPTQSGQVPDLLDAWFETPRPAFGSAIIPGSVGLLFDLGQSEAPRVGSMTLTFTLFAGALVAAATPALTVSVLHEVSTDPFGDTLHPLFSSSVPTIASFVDWSTFTGHHNRTWMWVTSVDTTQNADLGSIDFSFPLCPTTTNPITGAAVQDPYFSTLSAQTGQSYISPWGQSGWTGRIYVGLSPGAVGGFGTTFVDNPTLTVEWDSFFSGLRGGPYGGKHRFVRDSRYGMPASTWALQRDGDQPGLWVRAEDQDPKDPTNEYRPRPGEGSVDDGRPED